MADILENLILSESSTLPQLSDEHLTLLDNLQEQYNSFNNSLNHSDEFNLNNKINQQFHNYQLDQQDQFNLEQFNNFYSVDHLSNCSFEPSFSKENSNPLIYNNYFPSYQNEPVSNQQPIHNEYSQSSYPNNNLIELDNLDDLNEFNGFNKVNEFNNVNEFNSNQFVGPPVECISNQLVSSNEYTNHSVHSSIGYLNQIINSPIDNSSSSNDYYSNHCTNSPSKSVDYSNQTANSPTDFSIQSVNSSIDYSVQSANSIGYSYSLSNSSLSNSPLSNTSESSYETHFDYLNHSSHLNYSNSFTERFNSDNILTQSIQIKKSNEQDKIVKTKRKRSKKIISEEEIKRKLEIKLERKRRRLERKKIQNKNAARRYREKKKNEEDQINKRLMKAKDEFILAKQKLKKVLNEKRVLVKLLKEFADQSDNILLPNWMIRYQF